MRRVAISLPRVLFVATTAGALAVVSLLGCAPEDDVDEAASAATSGAVCSGTPVAAFDRGRPFTMRTIHVDGVPTTTATGHAFLKMQKAARADGVALSLTSGFRTMAKQQELYRCYKTRSCNGGALAATPGFSRHQNGRALDISRSPWLFANAHRFGFTNTVRSEPWHWEYAGEDPGGPCTRALATDDGGTDEDDERASPSTPDASSRPVSPDGGGSAPEIDASARGTDADAQAADAEVEDGPRTTEEEADREHEEPKRSSSRSAADGTEAAEDVAHACAVRGPGRAAPWSGLALFAAALGGLLRRGRARGRVGSRREPAP